MRGKRILLFSLLGVLLLGAGDLYAQRGLKGQIGAGVNFGMTDGFLLRGANGDLRFWSGIDVVRYNRNHSYWNFGVECLRKDYIYWGYMGRERVPLAQFTAEAGYNLPLVSDRGRNIALVGGVAGMLGYEMTAWGRKTLRDGATLRNRDTFLWGAALSVTLEGYLTDRVILLMRVRERCLPSSSTGAFHTQVGIGVRIIIN